MNIVEREQTQLSARLLPELINLIAKESPAVWIRLRQVDRRFNEYAVASTEEFTELFTVITHTQYKTEYMVCGKKHRDNDLPAVIHASGTQHWYKNGKQHRDNDLPAVIFASGTQEWHQNGKIHRDNDLPAIIYADGSQEWHQNGKIHRDNDLPAVIRASGTQEWYQNGKLHLCGWTCNIISRWATRMVPVWPKTNNLSVNTCILFFYKKIEAHVLYNTSIISQRRIQPNNSPSANAALISAANYIGIHEVILSAYLVTQLIREMNTFL
jgi:hypothetical protein